MIEDKRVEKWAQIARVSLARHLDKNEEIAHLPSIAFAAFTDLENLKHYVEQTFNER